MNRIVIPLVVLAAIALTLVLTWNMYFYYFDSQVRVGTILLTIVISLLTGLLTGFFIGLSQGRRGRKA